MFGIKVEGLKNKKFCERGCVMSNVQMVMMRTGRWAFSDPLVDLKSYCEVHNNRG